MAPSHEENHLAKGVMVYAGQIVEKKSSRLDKKIARSSGFKSLVLYLSEREPSGMDGLLKSASRKCCHALGMEKGSQIARKRAAPSNSNERDAKRNKITHSSEEATAPSQQITKSELIAQGHAEKQNLQKARLEVQSDTASPQGYSQCSKMAFLHTSASEKDRKIKNEDSEEGYLNVKRTENKSSSVVSPFVPGPQDGDTVFGPTKYDVETGLTMGTPTIMVSFRAYFLTLESSKSRPHSSIDDEISKILSFPKLFLEFYKTKHELHQYLQNRENMAGERLTARTAWNVSNPSEILDALENVKRNTADSKVHRAYGQTMLFSSVNTQVAGGYKSTVSGHRSDHTAILEELARKKVGAVSKPEIEQTISSHLHEYYAGQKWSAVIDWFGGSGIVLLFVTAGIGSYYVEKKWTDFQRDCLQVIAKSLHSIRALVETLGPDALELYCRHGCLGNDCIARVKLAKFTQPDRDEESEDEELGDGELGDGEPGDGKSGDGDEGDEGDEGSEGDGSEGDGSEGDGSEDEEDEDEEPEDEEPEDEQPEYSDYEDESD